jgi:hypothetical protein
MRYNVVTNNNRDTGVEVRTTKAAETHAAITRLADGGMRLADAVRQLAAQTGRSEAAIRASYYYERAKLGQHGRDGRGRPPAGPFVDDAIREARQLLERALKRVDEELEAAKGELDAAAERYETLRTAAAERKSELERRIAAL